MSLRLRTDGLHCAVTGRVDYLVTYDRDLLEIGAIEEIPIVTPAALLAALTPDDAYTGRVIAPSLALETCAAYFAMTPVV